jgi:hypothetical protein
VAVGFVQLDHPKFRGPRLEKASPTKLPPFKPPKLYRAERLQQGDIARPRPFGTDVQHEALRA